MENNEELRKWDEILKFADWDEIEREIEQAEERYRKREGIEIHSSDPRGCFHYVERKEMEQQKQSLLSSDMTPEEHDRWTDQLLELIKPEEKENERYEMITPETVKRLFEEAQAEEEAKVRNSGKDTGKKAEQNGEQKESKQESAQPKQQANKDCKPFNKQNFRPQLLNAKTLSDHQLNEQQSDQLIDELNNQLMDQYQSKYNQNGEGDWHGSQGMQCDTNFNGLSSQQTAPLMLNNVGSPYFLNSAVKVSTMVPMTEAMSSPTTTGKAVRRRGRKPNITNTLKANVPKRPYRRRQPVKSVAEAKPEFWPKPDIDVTPFINPLVKEIYPKVIVQPAHREWVIPKDFDSPTILEACKPFFALQPKSVNPPASQPAPQKPKPEKVIPKTFVDPKPQPFPTLMAPRPSPEVTVTRVPPSQDCQHVRYLVVMRDINGNEQSAMVNDEQLQQLLKLGMPPCTWIGFVPPPVAMPPPPPPRPIEPFKHAPAMPSILKQKAQAKLRHTVQNYRESCCSYWGQDRGRGGILL
ncbi:uncharacterized protein LOC115633412 [Scaptodrosophila lebanonensis]|uniref:Uncharacterized protein LOC115633412 n=1 Tax=Drosophila lebanonensis TaxID=7225 RepID=A0A6J2UE19_DROLE|nr:uncharacterized protein LOC115633412 [Scaptodrosophila lebanonensis]